MTHRPNISLTAYALPLALAFLLSACETPIHDLRSNRFADSEVRAPVVAPRALALALQVSTDGQGLTPASLQQANSMLGSQGRLQAQSLSITPFNARGEAVAQRLAKALLASGAQSPKVLSIPTEPGRLEAASRQSWDLELQSEAMVVRASECRVADPSGWMVHPYTAIGALGCANRANVAQMARDPRDLVRPRTLDAADGSAAVLAVKRYQEGEIRDLIDIDFDN